MRCPSLVRDDSWDYDGEEEPELADRSYTTDPKYQRECNKQVTKALRATQIRPCCFPEDEQIEYVVLDLGLDG